MVSLQHFVQSGRRYIPRGWSPLLRTLSYLYPKGRNYPAKQKNGETLIIDLSESMCHGYFYFGELAHEKYTESMLNYILQPGDTFLDVGANIGYLSKVASKLVEDTGKVHAFEPMPEAIRLLQKNVKDSKNVIIHELALGNFSGNSEFSVNKKGDRSALGHNPSAKRYISVQVETLDKLLEEEYRIDLIKIDVEGYEFEVLEGATKLIRKHAPLLYFEYLENYTNERMLTVGKYADLLSPMGYKLAWMNPMFPAGNLTTNDTSCYILGIPINDRWGVLV